MLKEKRELTLKKLEEMKRICEFVKIALGILFCLYIIYYILMAIKIPFTNITNIQIIISTLLFIFIMISYKVSQKIEKCIEIKRKQIQVLVIKELAKAGELKGAVSIIDKQIITDILSRNIESIVIDSIENENFVTTIELKNAKCQQKVYISTKSLISILDENSKKEMLENIINNIKIKNLEKETTRVEISSEDFLYINLKTTDEKLLEIFELKEE